jgi:hypothetical protein
MHGFWPGLKKRHKKSRWSDGFLLAFERFHSSFYYAWLNQEYRLQVNEKLGFCILTLSSCHKGQSKSKGIKRDSRFK